MKPMVDSGSNENSIGFAIPSANGNAYRFDKPTVGGIASSFGGETHAEH